MTPHALPQAAPLAWVPCWCWEGSRRTLSSPQISIATSKALQNRVAKILSSQCLSTRYWCTTETPSELSKLNARRHSSNSDPRHSVLARNRRAIARCHKRFREVCLEVCSVKPFLEPLQVKLLLLVQHADQHCKKGFTHFLPERKHLGHVGSRIRSCAGGGRKSVQSPKPYKHTVEQTQHCPANLHLPIPVYNVTH